MSNRLKIKKKNKAPAKLGAGPSSSGSDSPLVLQFYEYQITDEPIEENLIPEAIRDEMEELHYLCQEHPEQTIDRLESLLERYPEVHQVYNYLSMAYQLTRQVDKCNALILKTYERHPDYLFAKTAYAELCMQRKQFDRIPEIFDSDYDLKLLYPERNVFHYTEAVALAGTLGYYFWRIGKPEQAKMYYKTLQELDPDHLYTRRLERCFAAESTLGRLLR
jgi:tetratricopeptide (TPR) repeat protein